MLKVGPFSAQKYKLSSSSPISQSAPYSAPDFKNQVTREIRENVEVSDGHI